jgi:transcriptional regulator with XRE-family HTH domain
VTPTKVVVEQLKMLRRRRGLNTAAVAARCAQLGAPEVTDQVVRNIETGRRTVSVDHLCVLALALDVAPVHLLTPLDTDGPIDVRVGTDLSADRAAWSAWVHGKAPLPAGANPQAFWGYALEHAEPDDGQAMLTLARTQASTAVARVMAQVQADSAQEITAVRAAGQAALELVARAAQSDDPTVLQEALTRARQAVSGTAGV